MVLALWIALGSALGGVLRYGCAELAAHFLGTAFPWGTLLVNISGCFVIGFFATLTGADGRVWASPTQRQFVMTGLCGGFTTFSSFSLQTLTLAQDGALGRAGLNVLGSVGLCLLSVYLGAIAAHAFNQLKGN